MNATYPRPKQWGYDHRQHERDATVVRGIYAARFDRAYTDGEFGRLLRNLLGEDAPDAFAALAVELFPEDYGVPARDADGLVPRTGGTDPKRLANALAVLARKVVGRPGGQDE